jgi:GTP-binding protein LepA
MGYVRFGLRDPRLALPGSFLIWSHHVNKAMALPKSQLDSDPLSSACVLYASVHPQEASGFEELCAAVDRLALNDTGLSVQRTASVGGGSSSSTSSSAGGSVGLGPGLRVGFQGLLHVEVFRQRLRDEFGIDAVVTPPKVPYTVTYLPSAKSGVKEEYTVVVEDLSQWPDPGRGKFVVQEPMVTARILAPVESAGAVMELIKSKRGSDWQTTVMDDEQWMFVAQLPWAEVVTDFSDVLKNITSGFGSVDVSEGDPPLKEAQLTKVDICLNSEVVEPLAFVCHQDAAQAQARAVCQRLQTVLPRQQFVTVIQAKAGSKVIASERIKAYRKDVLTKSGKVVGGGDMTRKKKLLEKQKEGKKKMQTSGKVALSQEAFNSVISRS